MGDLSLTTEQVRQVLDAVAHDKSAAEMMQCDAICYGGDVRKLSDDVRHLERILKAFPKETIDAYNAALRKDKANELRAEADKIERGVA